MLNLCRCEQCSTEPALTWTEEWRALTEAYLVASWPKEQRDRYYKMVKDKRGTESVRGLVEAVNLERKSSPPSP